MLSISRKFDAYLDDMFQLTILLPYSYFDGKSSSFSLCLQEHKWDVHIKEVVCLEEHMKYICETNAIIQFGQTYEVIDDRGMSTDLQIGAVIRTDHFDELFYYEGNDLGANIMANGTLFKVWAPTATAVKVRYKQPLTGKVKEEPLIRGENGIWSQQLTQNLEGYYYSFLVCINLCWHEAVDPYAKALSVNSEWGVVVDLRKTLQLNTPPPPFSSPTEAIIYEVHVRDLTSHPKSGVKQKGKYLGLIETNTKTVNGYSTAFSYVKELGVTHVELLPVNDFGGVDELQPSKSYNWGYNPLFFNTPEGSYSSAPADPYARINELKRVIHHFHLHDLRVILDVVYNHVYIQETSSFEKIVPGYYFRYDSRGFPSNGTGVGNDLASERKMVRKFIVDSVAYWLKEYKVDGFRFDLMGNLDLKTMREVKETVERIHPGALLLGEGWDLPTTLPQKMKAINGNSRQLTGISFFHDRFRDCLKGSTFDLKETGFTLGKKGMEKEIVSLFIGHSIIDGVKEGDLVARQSINYVECHDNYTLWDKISAIYPNETELNEKRHRLASCMVLLSHGTPFLHGGQEFFRTKQGVENSYNSPDAINWFDWNLREKNDENIEYLKTIIALRKQQKVLQLDSREQITKHLLVFQAANGIISLHYKDIREFGQWNDLFIVFHANSEPQNIQLPEGNWGVLVNRDQAALTPIKRNLEHEVEVEALSVNIFCTD
ncbi:type I pullulanase [Bacillus spongiae]|uniref:Type I pullulanase n=1 Tax=Bacillus spongiae TaxID=2683610 RepID=A0ABU8HI57_9BACI